MSTTGARSRVGIGVMLSDRINLWSKSNAQAIATLVVASAARRETRTRCAKTI